jgi:hypothetical protein
MRSAGQPDLHFVADNARFVLRYANRGILYQRSGRHVELPSVPWTRDDAAENDAVGQRSSSVQAQIIDGEVPAVEVEEADPSLVDRHLAARAGRNVANAGDRDERAILRTMHARSACVTTRACRSRVHFACI